LLLQRNQRRVSRGKRQETGTPPVEDDSSS
jgi:hypothetical protein